MTRAVVLAAVVAFVAALLPVRDAAAHANLVRSEPAANSVLPDAPAAVQLWFSEDPEPRFSEIVIYSSARNRVQTGPVQVAPEDHRVLYVKVDALPPGTYTVAWKALSAVDGHTTAGALAFAVGVGQAVAAPDLTLLSQVGQTSQATPPSVVLRWFGYLAAAGLLGGLAFVPLVLEPALVALRARVPVSDRAAGRDKELARPWPDSVRLAVGRRTLTLALACFWLTVVASAAAAVAQAAQAAGVPFWRALMPIPGQPLGTLLLQTRYGQIWIGRLLLLALVALVMSRLRVSARPLTGARRGQWLAALALAALVPLTTSLNSHAAAMQGTQTPGVPWLPIAADWLHLVSTGLWIGGLAALVVALPAGFPATGPSRRTALLAAVVPAFSTLALVCVALLFVTGLYQSVLQVASWAALFGTTYGRALVVKLALFGILVVLGAFNLLIARPRLAREATAYIGIRDVGGTARLFRWAVNSELIVAAGVVAAVGVMTLSQPAKDAWAELNRGITQERTVSDLRLRLRVDPGEPGFNAFGIYVRDARSGKPITDAEKVALIFTMVEHDMGQNEVVLDSSGDGWYRGSTGLTSMTGTWEAEALIRRQGRDDVRHTFELKLGDTLGATGVAGQGTAVPAGTPVAPSEARALRNPIPPSEQSLATGQQIYVQNCLVCHGVQGRGDGPAALALRPRPADLTQHVTAHTEGELWWWVTNGVAGTQMPAWKAALSDEERWNVVNYIVDAFSPKNK